MESKDEHLKATTDFFGYGNELNLIRYIDFRAWASEAKPPCRNNS